MYLDIGLTLKIPWLKNVKMKNETFEKISAQWPFNYEVDYVTPVQIYFTIWNKKFSLF